MLNDHGFGQQLIDKNWSIYYESDVCSVNFVLTQCTVAPRSKFYYWTRENYCNFEMYFIQGYESGE